MTRPAIPLARARVIPGAVADAACEAARILAEARREADDIRRRARADGLAEGRAEAAAALAAARVAAARRVAEAEREIGALAVAVAARVVGREIAHSPDAVMAAVRDVIGRARRLARARSLALWVHPDDRELVARTAAPLVDASGGELVVHADPAITRGGCVLECELGRFDARVETQLAALERAIASAAAGSAREPAGTGDVHDRASEAYLADRADDEAR